MTKTLTVHNAEVRTAAVEVRSLTISGKQVTLAVFRQLIEEHPFTENAEWKGLPWGFVNYLNDDKGARHIVWQLGTELRRGIVKQPPVQWRPVHRPLASLYVTALICLGHVPSMRYSITTREDDDPPDHHDLARHGLVVDLGDGLKCHGYLRARQSHRTDAWEWDTKDAVDLDDLATSLPLWRQRLIDEMTGDRAYWRAERVRWQEILALNQLFIAV